MKDFVYLHKDRLQLEFLPAYAPELNPVEYLWAHAKQHGMPNLCPDNSTQLRRAARRALSTARRRPSLLRAFWKQAELF